jgi:hypothetical protein
MTSLVAEHCILGCGTVLSDLQHPVLWQGWLNPELGVGVLTVSKIGDFLLLSVTNFLFLWTRVLITIIFNIVIILLLFSCYYQQTNWHNPKRFVYYLRDGRLEIRPGHPLLYRGTSPSLQTNLVNCTWN